MRYQELRRLTGDDGNDRRGLNMSLIREIEIPLPSIASQAKTIEDLKLADQSTQDLKKRIELKKEHVKNLRIVLLSKSFSKKIEVN
jgi:type I restriction enzyme S subunit